MIQDSRSQQRLGVALTLTTALAVAVSLLPAGIGNVGRKSNITSGSFARVTLPGGVSITHTIVPGQTAEQIRDVLVTRINNETSFTAITFNDPADPNLAAFRVSTAGNPPMSLQVDENDTNIDDIGVRYLSGRPQATFRKVNSAGNSVAANGVYSLRVELIAGTDYSQTFSTSTPPNNTAAGLDATIKGSLMSAGFTVVETGTSFVVSKAGDLIAAVQVDSSDTGINVHDVLMFMPSATPSLTEYALFLLAALLTGVGMLGLARRRKENTNV